MFVLILSQGKWINFAVVLNFHFAWEKNDYQMAHGYFYILYGKIPADNYDILQTFYVLCYEYLAISLVITP